MSTRLDFGVPRGLLSDPFMLWGEEEGKRRRSMANDRGLEDRIAASRLRHDILGARGELAAALYLGLMAHVFLETTPVRDSIDLPPDIDVKTSSRHHYDLKCARDEAPWKTLLLVTLEGREARIQGWIRAEDAMRLPLVTDVPGWTPHYRVPHEMLQDPALLIQGRA